ncbi:MAG: GDSL-type esterase/lipase family protein, partial [Clostridia bacterium]|nr:GDSL-type esterase/lipase family protein [Clostridia bacterium]
EVVIDNLTVTDNLGNVVLERTYETGADDPARTYFSLKTADQIHTLYPVTQNGALLIDAASGSAVTYTVPDSVVAFKQTVGAQYRISFKYRAVTRLSSGTEFAFLQNGSETNNLSGNSGNTRGNVWTATQVTDMAEHSGQVTYTAQTSVLQLRVSAGASFIFDDIQVEQIINENTKAQLNANLRRSGNAQYVDVTFNTGASSRQYKYGIDYDPTVLEYVSTAAATGTSGISASAKTTVTPAKERMVIDATTGETRREFDFSNSIQYTNTTGDALSSCPQPTYFSMRVRCTGATQDIHGYEFHAKVNDGNYYPSHHYRDVPVLNEWTVVEFPTHSNPPAGDGQNTLSIMVYPGVVMEIDYIRIYSGWDTSSTLLTNLQFAGEGEPTPASATVNVSASAYSYKTGNIATSTFRVIGDVEGMTDFGLSVTSPTSVVNVFGTSVGLNNNYGRLSARTDDGNVRFAISLPVDDVGENYLTEDGTTVRPISKGFLMALGYHAAQNMTVASKDPYIQKVQVTTPSSTVIGGVRYTVAVTDPLMDPHTYISARFYVEYTANGQTKYAYSKPLSVMRCQLENLSADKWLTAPSADGSVTLTLDNSAPVQQNWQGANAVAQGFIYNNGYTDAQINTEISRMKSMGINMVRSYFDQTFNTSYSSTRNSLIYSYTSDRMQCLEQWLQTMKNNDIEVALNMSWAVSDIFEQPYTGYDGWNNNSGNAIPNSFNAYYKKNGREKAYTLYGDWVNKSINYLINERGFTNIKYLILFTEPGVSSYGNDNWVDYLKLVDSADSALKTGGNRNLVKLVGPNIGMGDSTHFGGTVEEDLQYFAALSDKLDIYSFHFYAPHWPGSGGTNTMDDASTDNYARYTEIFNRYVAFAESLGKPYWFDEFNYSAGSGGIMAQQEDPLMGTQYAQAIASAMNSGVENALLWQLFEIKWPGRESSGWEFENGTHVIGLAPSLLESDVPYKPYYAYSLLTKYLGERGSTVYAGGGSGGVYNAMVENPDGTKSIMVVNTGNAAKTVTTSFSNPLANESLYRVCYNPTLIYPDSSAEVIGADSIITGVSTTLTDVVPANSFVIYTTIGYEAQHSATEEGEYVLGGNLTAQMKQDSVLNQGNRARLKEKIGKLKNGENVTVAFIGGSITEGYFAEPQMTNRHATQFVAWLRKTYPNATVTELNAGIGATTSYLGVHRADAVLAQDPDIVIIDFAVNDDSGSELYQASFESLINMAWNAQSSPAVLCLAMAGKSNDKLINSQNDELPILECYGIPFLSYRDMIEPLLNNGVIRWEDIQADTVHPNTNGHGLIAQMLAAYFEKVAQSVVTESEPDFGAVANKNAPYANGTMLTVHNSSPAARYFTADTATRLQGFVGYWSAERSGAQLKFDNVEAQYIGVAYEEVDSTTSAATFEVYVDGTLVDTIDPHGPCGHAMGRQVYIGIAGGTHTVNIKTKSADSCKIIGLLVS